MSGDALAEAFKTLPTRDLLIVDIERQAGLSYRFDQRGPTFVPVHAWKRLPTFLCWAAKWHGKRPIEFAAAWDDPQIMAEQLWVLYDRADIVITYNGVKFDNKWIRSLWQAHGLPSAAPWKDIDLYRVNKATFGRDSYSLAHLAQQLGIPGKQGHYDPALADLCMEGDETARRTMERYNKGDVRLTERVYDLFLPWIGQHPHVKTNSGETPICPRCGCTEFKRLEKPYLAAVMEYAAYRCARCKGIYRAGLVRRVARTRGVTP